MLLWLVFNKDWTTALRKLLNPTSGLPHKNIGILSSVLPKNTTASLPAFSRNYLFRAEGQAAITIFKVICSTPQVN